MAAGEVKATLFDEAVLETLADSLLPLTEEQQQRLPQHLAAAARAAAAGGGLQQLREYALSTFVRRYLNRSHLRHVSNERAAVNSLRFLEVGVCLALIVRNFYCRDGLMLVAWHWRLSVMLALCEPLAIAAHAAGAAGPGHSATRAGGGLLMWACGG